MNLGNLKTMSRARVPGAKATTIPEAVLTLILNQGKDELCSITRCLPENSKFDVVAEQAEYDLTSSLTRFIMPQESGCWWNAGDGTTTNWQKLDAVTIKWLDENKPSWRDSSSGSPLYYYIEGDKLNIHPKPSTALTNGLWMYYFQKSEDMSNDAHFPFGGANEISRLAILSEAILLYWEMRANFMLNEEELALRARDTYIRERSEKLMLLNVRPDLVNSDQAIMRMPYIGE